MVQDILVRISELDCAGQYDPQLTLTMLKSIQSNCSQGGDFDFELFSKIKEVSSELRTCKFLPFNEANKLMLEKELDPESVLEFVQEKYEELLNDSDWEPAKRPTDKSNPSINNVLSGLSKEELIAVLVEANTKEDNNKKKKTPQNSPCHICGKLGHWAPDSPKKDKSKDKNTSGPKMKIVDSQSSSRSWKKTPPESGQSETKIVNKKEFFWCNKCKRWTTTHSTATHRGSSKDKEPSKDVLLASTMDIDPSSVWLVTNSTDDLESSVLHQKETYEFTSISNFGLVLAYIFFTIYFLPTFGLSRTSCLVGLVKSVFDLVLCWQASISSFISFQKMSTWWASYDLVELLGQSLIQIPFQVFLAPLLWSSLFIALTFTRPKHDKPQGLIEKQIRVGRIPDPETNRWYRNKRRHRNGPSGRGSRLSLRQRVQKKRIEDVSRLYYGKSYGKVTNQFQRKMTRRSKSSRSSQKRNEYKVSSSSKRYSFNRPCHQSVSEFSPEVKNRFGQFLSSFTSDVVPRGPIAPEFHLRSHKGKRKFQSHKINSHRSRTFVRAGGIDSVRKKQDPFIDYSSLRKSKVKIESPRFYTSSLPESLRQ